MDFSGAKEEDRSPFLFTRNLSRSFLHANHAREASTRNPSTLPVAAPATMVLLGAEEEVEAAAAPPPPLAPPPHAPVVMVGVRVAGEGEAEKVGLGYIRDTPAPGVEAGRELMLGPPRV